MRMRVHNETYWRAGNLSNRCHDLVVKDSEIGVNKKNSVITCEDHNMTACSGGHVYLTRNMPDDPRNLGSLLNVVNLVVESPHVGEETSGRNILLSSEKFAANNNRNCGDQAEHHRSFHRT